MDKIHRVWEIELQAVLEINKIGHRKRILYSLSSHDSDDSSKSEENTNNNNNDINIKSDTNSSETNSTHSSSKVDKKSDPAVTNPVSSRHKNRKNRQAPKPPTQTNNLEIRQPSELLLTNQGSLNAQWKHSSAALVSESIKYEAFVSFKTIISLN